MHSKGKVLDFLSGEDLPSWLESLRLYGVEDWLDERTRLSAVGNLATGRKMVSRVWALLEGVFSGISPTWRSKMNIGAVGGLHKLTCGQAIQPLRFVKFSQVILVEGFDIRKFV
jgi:hypothetical protein